MKAHLILTTTALSLGYAAGFSTDGLLAATTIVDEFAATTSTTVAAGNPTTDDIRQKAATALCTKVETEQGLEAGDCTKANVKGVSIVYDEEGGTVDRVSIRAVWEASTTLGPPQ